jgi:hypothetical protein
MQLPRVTDGTTTLLYLADLVPTVAHLRTPWVMAYDLEPLKTIGEKLEWIGRAADEDWVLFFEHDPERAAGRVRRTNRDFGPGEPVLV